LDPIVVDPPGQALGLGARGEPRRGGGHLGDVWQGGHRAGYPAWRLSGSHHGAHPGAHHGPTTVPPHSPARSSLIMGPPRSPPWCSPQSHHGAHPGAHHGPTMERTV